MSRCISLVLALSLLTTALFAQTDSDAEPVIAEKPVAAKPRIKITISKETTFLTGPLTKDGFVDYVAALNRQYGKGVTVENNAAVPFWRVFGPEEISKQYRKHFFEALGIEELPEQGDYLVPLLKFAKLNKSKDAPSTTSPVYSDWYRNLLDSETQVLNGPWNRKDFPLIAKWLDAHDGKIDILIEATRHKRMATPLGVSSNRRTALYGEIANVLSTLTNARGAARALIIRAMLRLGEGKIEEAHQDAMAVHRLAGLLRQGSTLVEYLVACGIETYAWRVDVKIASSELLTINQAKTFLSDLRELQPIPSVVEKIDIANRYFYLDTASKVIQGRPKDVGIYFLEEQSNVIRSVRKLIHESTMDVNIILRMGNRHFDRFAEAASTPEWQSRIRSLKRIENEIQKNAENVRETLAKSDHREGFFQMDDNERSQLLGKLFLYNQTKSLSNAIRLEARMLTKLELAVIAYALAGYRAEHGEYPEKLSQLVPKWLEKLPEDVFSGKEFRYKREQNGYLLYSVGTNGKDDAGRTFDSDPPGDDLVIDTRNKKEADK